LIANAFYLPRHLMRMPEETKAVAVTEAGSETLQAIEEEASYGE
jgi:hypothetical protein